MDPSVLARKQLTELKDIASQLQMRGYQRLKKAELIQAIVTTAAGSTAPTSSVDAGSEPAAPAPAPAAVAVAERPVAEPAPPAPRPASNGQLPLDGEGETRTRVRTRSRDRGAPDGADGAQDEVAAQLPLDGDAGPRRRSRRERIEARAAEAAEGGSANGAAPSGDDRAPGGDATRGDAAPRDAGTAPVTADGAESPSNGGAPAADASQAPTSAAAQASEGDAAAAVAEGVDGVEARGNDGDRGRPQERARSGGADQQRQVPDRPQPGDDEAGGRRRRSRRERRRNKGQGGSGQGVQGGQQQPRFRDDDTGAEPGEIRSGVLDVLPEGYGFLRTSGYLPGDSDVYVSQSQIRKHGLRRGDIVEGPIRQQRAQEKVPALHSVTLANSHVPAEDGSLPHRPDFKDMTPLFPEERLRLETPDGPISMRIVDLMSPIGKGQRGLIVSPPKAGKTTILKELGQAIAYNNPECHVMVVLVDERPEEVTDMQRSVPGEIIASTFDRPADDHTQIAELAMERAKRLVEQGRDVVVLLDSITRLARAYNLAAPASGRIMSGGVDSTALYPPKRFFGAARNIEGGGSLTIIASALVETGSKMDEVIFEEFKGTGNCELRLDRRLEQKRIFPALDIDASGTRKEELLLDREEIPIIWKLRRVLHALDGPAAIELLIDKMKQTRSNNQFLLQIQKSNLQG